MCCVYDSKSRFIRANRFIRVLFCARPTSPKLWILIPAAAWLFLEFINLTANGIVTVRSPQLRFPISTIPSY